MSLLRTEALQVGYHGRALLPPIDLAIDAGEIWAVVGRNGSGKSTVIKTALGLLAPIAGRVIQAPGLRMAYVPQRDEYDAAVPGRVIDVVRSGRDRGWSFLRPGFLRAPDGGLDQAIAQCALGDLLRQPFATLSEGQKQRALMARALVSDPQIMLLDEPTSAMDPVHEEAIFALLHRLATTRAIAILVISHQLSFVPRYATHVLLVDKDGAAIEAGPSAAVLAGPISARLYGDRLSGDRSDARPSRPAPEAAHG